MPQNDKAKGLKTFHGITAGTVTASKALVVDANKDLASLRNLTLTGTLTAGALSLGSGSLGDISVTSIKSLTVGNGSASGSGISGTATANGMTGRVASTVMTAAPGSTYTLTVNNTTCTGTASVMAQVQSYTGAGFPVILSVAAGSSSFTVVFLNASTTDSLNAAVTISFLVVKG